MRKKISKKKKQKVYTRGKNVVNGGDDIKQQGNENNKSADSAGGKNEGENTSPKSRFWIYFERVVGVVAGIATILGFIYTSSDKKGIELDITPTMTPTATATPVPERNITNISINSTKLELQTGETAQLVVNAICSDNSLVDNILWVSDDPAVVEVDQNGSIVARSEGTVNVTAQALVDNDSKSISCLIDVIGPPTGYSISLGAYNVEFNENFRVEITPYGKNIREIWIHAKAPSGHVDDLKMDRTGIDYFRIDTEKGRWEIYATIVNGAGTYEASKPEDIVYLEVE